MNQNNFEGDLANSTISTSLILWNHRIHKRKGKKGWNVYIYTAMAAMALVLCWLLCLILSAHNKNFQDMLDWRLLLVLWFCGSFLCSLWGGGQSKQMLFAVTVGGQHSICKYTYYWFWSHHAFVKCVIQVQVHTVCFFRSWFCFPFGLSLNLPCEMEVGLSCFAGVLVMYGGIIAKA